MIQIYVKCIYIAILHRVMKKFTAYKWQDHI